MLKCERLILAGVPDIKSIIMGKIETEVLVLLSSAKRVVNCYVN